MTRSSLVALALTSASFVAVVSGCSGTTKAPSSATPVPGTLAYDQEVWHSLLADHESIRRDVRFTTTGVEAVTESDDPAVAAKIIDHALAMQRRMQKGSQVRVWDPVFVSLFKNHEKIELSVTPTDKGVRIVESSNDPEVVKLLHAHASGVSDFVREGFAAASRETPMSPNVQITSVTPPPSIERLVVLPGVPHRFDPGQPDASAIQSLKAEGLTTVIDFRKPAERPDFDERAAVEGAGLRYVNIPYGGDTELTDEVFDRARETFRGLDTPALMHCRTGNRVGAVWLPYRALDGGLTWDQALAEARAVGLKNPQLEAKAKDYVERHQAGGR